MTNYIAVAEAAETNAVEDVVPKHRVVPFDPYNPNKVITNTTIDTAIERLQQIAQAIRSNVTRLSQHNVTVSPMHSLQNSSTPTTSIRRRNSNIIDISCKLFEAIEEYPVTVEIKIETDAPIVFNNTEEQDTEEQDTEEQDIEEQAQGHY